MPSMSGQRAATAVARWIASRAREEIRVEVSGIGKQGRIWCDQGDGCEHLVGMPADQPIADDFVRLA